ncbi:MAG: NAD kinase [Candidatus Nanopelagicales bacterium]
MTRQVCLVMHANREDVPPLARVIADRLQAAGIEVAVAGDQHELEGFASIDPVRNELVIVLGGDGTILRAAEMFRDSAVPLLGLNLGRVGFLAELEASDVDELITVIEHRAWTVENRRALAVRVVNPDGSEWHSWALNEVAVEKSLRDRMLEVIVSVEGHPVMAWAGDGLICATPTGSTAYAFSAGGPIIWPAVDAHLLVPVAAHALFARPLVTAPSASIDIAITDELAPAIVVCDGRRNTEAQPGAHVMIEQSEHPVRFARIKRAPFANRLVAKFQLPVTGWRNREQA